MRSAVRPIGIGVVLAIVAGSGVWLANRERPEPPTSTSPAGLLPENSYLGSESCARCHPGEAFRHARSGHARTLAHTRNSEAARGLDGKTFYDEERGFTFHYRWNAEGLTVTVPEQLGDEPFPLDWSFGTGEHGVTFLTLIPNRAGQTVGIEHRVSLFGADHRPGLTPHHGGLKATQDVEKFGRVIRDARLEACIGCHTTTAPADGDESEPLTIMNRHLNIGCERCHGPGGRHVQAVADRRDDLQILFGKGRAGAAGEVRLCGECHRHPEMLGEAPIEPDNVRLVRFQPVGFLQSACYRKSSGAMSCTTCHDPHEYVRKQQGEFDSRCLSCHAIDGSRFAVCPRSPRENCVACHMPEVEVRPGTKFHDHWIRVRKEELTPGGDHDEGREDSHPLPESLGD